MDTLTPRQQFCLSQREKFMKGEVPPVAARTYISSQGFIHPTVVFCEHGFGYEKMEGLNTLIPHSGKIIIGHDVHIHALTTVCPGTGDDDETRIGDNTKIDTRCHIAHNVKIGNNCLITSGVTIGGSAVIGDDVYIGIGAIIRNKIKIGNGATIGMGAVVVADVPEGITVIGNPAKPFEK